MYKDRENIKYWDGIENDNLERNVYDKLNKRYWNDDKKKWVGYKLKDKVVNKSYYRYEFKCFGINECKLLFGDEVNYDRVLKFIDLIYRRYIFNKSSSGLIKYLRNEDYVRVLNRDLLDYLGNSIVKYNDDEVRNWEYILKVLDDSDIIDVYWGGKNKYDSRKKLWWIRLSNIFINSEKKWKLIENNELLRYLRKKNKKIEDSLDKRNKWEVDCCKLLSFEISDDELNNIIDIRFNNKKEENLDKLSWEILSEKRENSVKKKIVRKWVNNISDSFYFDYFEDEYKSMLLKDFENFNNVLKNLKNGNYLDDRFIIDGFGGRYYNIVSNLNRNFRKCLKLDGDEIVEIDIRNSYISFYFSFIGFIVDFENEKEFGIEIFEEIRNRCNNKWGWNFYNYYNDFVFKYKDSVDFYKVIGFNLFGLNVKNYSRNYIKEIVNRIINSDNLILKDWNINNMNIREIKEKIFMEDGSEFMDKIKSIYLNDILKIKDYKRYNNLNCLVGRLESEVMRKCMDILIDNNIKFISLFDSFLLKRVDSEKVLIMLNEVLKSYGNKLKFKV
jgi:hypothetical protein